MALHAFAFYVFAFFVIASAVMVVTSRNPVHSVLFLILAFFNAAGLMILIGAEFVAMLLVIVYVGAVAVLFLFVVMMLDINFEELRRGLVNYLPIGAVIGMILVAEMIFVAGAWESLPGAIAARQQPMVEGVENTAALGRILYTDYILAFQAAGMILLVAMIGAIVLTLRERRTARRQEMSLQTARDPAAVLAIKSVDTGSGA